MSAPFGVVPVHPIGPVAVATLTTLWRGAVRVTVVVKATLSFAVDGDMPLAAPTPIVRADVHFGNQPERSVHDSSDLAPHLERAEILFRGHAHAPGGTPAPQMRVRLALAGERGVVLDKALVVIGDRTGSGEAPAPFAKMRIGYERTAGGPDDPVNPVGVGFTGGLPNVLYADPARASEPACFGPLAAAWPVRRALLRRADVIALDAGPVTLPDDLDWSYFQAAPLDQRLPELPERAWILLEGLHPEHPSLRMRLPHLVGTARLYARSQGETTLGLRADTVLVDGESQHCTVTWRGTFGLPSTAALQDLVVAAAGVHAPGQTLAWPVMPAPPPRKPVTMMGIDQALLRAALPFQPVAAGEVPKPVTLGEPPRPPTQPIPAVAIAGAPWSAVPAVPPVLDAADDGGTMLLRSPVTTETPPAVTVGSGPVAPPAMVAPEPPPAAVAPPHPPAVAAPPAAVARPVAPAPRVAPATAAARPHAASAARPAPAPIASIPRVPEPGAASRKAYGKFGQKGP